MPPKTNAASRSDTQGYLDHRLRIVELALEPALTLARAMALPLDDLMNMTERGYFRQFRERGLSFTATAQRLGKSRRSIAYLAQDAKRSERDEESKQLTLRRMILQKLAAEGAMTLSALRRHFPGKSSAALQETLETLQADSMVRSEGNRFALDTTTFNLLGEERERRLASLQQFLQAVTDVVFQRFFTAEGNAEALARVMSFRTSKAALRRIGSSCFAALRDQVFEADREQEKRGGAGDSSGLTASIALFYAEEPKAPALRR